MEYKNEHQRQMAILDAALPYVNPNSRHAIRLFLQADSLIHLAKQEGPGEDDFSLEAAGLDAVPAEPQSRTQEMLQHIQEFLTPREADIVQTLLNFMNAGKLLQNYRDFVSLQNSQASGTPDLSSASSEQNTGNPFHLLFQMINGLGSLGGSFVNSQKESSAQNTLLRDFLLSQLPPEQKNTFEQMQNIIYNNFSEGQSN